MLLTIHNLPSSMRYNDVKSLLLSKCGLSDLILDNLQPEGATKRVTVGVSDEGDAAMLVRKINGLYMEGRQLYVEDVRKKRESEQPFRTSTTQDQQYSSLLEQQYTPQVEQGRYTADNGARTAHAQFLVPQQLAVPNYPMMGYCVPQIQDLSYLGYQNQATIPGMQVFPEAPIVQEQVSSNNYNQDWPVQQQQAVVWDENPVQTNNSEDSWRNNVHSSRSPQRGGFKGKPHSYNQQSKSRWNDPPSFDNDDRNTQRNPPPVQWPKDQYNSARNDDNPFRREQSPSRNRGHFDPSGGRGRGRNSQDNSMFPQTSNSVDKNNTHQRPILRPPLPRSQFLEPRMSRPERLSRPEPIGNKAWDNQAPNARFQRDRPFNEEPPIDDQESNSRFQRDQNQGGRPFYNQVPNPRFQREQNQGLSAAGRPFRDGPPINDQSPNSRFQREQNLGGRPFRDRPPINNKTPNSRFQREQNQGPSAASRPFREGPSINNRAPNSRFQREQNSGGRPFREGPPTSKPFGSRDSSFTRKNTEWQPPVKKTRFSNEPGPFDRPDQKPNLEKLIKRDTTRKGQAASVISKEIIQNVQKDKVYTPDFAEVKALRQAIRARLDIILGSEFLGIGSEQMVTKYRSTYGPETDSKLFNLIMVRVKKEREAKEAASMLSGQDEDPVTIAAALQECSEEPKPATSEPATSKPATSKPATSKPATSKPAASKPATSKPLPSTSELQKNETAPANYKPMFPQDKTKIKQQKDIRNKEYSGELEYTLEPTMQAALDSEMDAIVDIVKAECVNPKDDCEKVVSKHVTETAASELKRNIARLAEILRVLCRKTNYEQKLADPVNNTEGDTESVENIGNNQTGCSKEEFVTFSTLDKANDENKTEAIINIEKTKFGKIISRLVNLLKVLYLQAKSTAESKNENAINPTQSKISPLQAKSLLYIGIMTKKLKVVQATAKTISERKNSVKSLEKVAISLENAVKNLEHDVCEKGNKLCFSESDTMGTSDSHFDDSEKSRNENSTNNDDNSIEEPQHCNAQIKDLEFLTEDIILCTSQTQSNAPAMVHTSPSETQNAVKEQKSSPTLPTVDIQQTAIPKLQNENSVHKTQMQSNDINEIVFESGNNTAEQNLGAAFDKEQFEKDISHDVENNVYHMAIKSLLMDAPGFGQKKENGEKNLSNCKPQQNIDKPPRDYVDRKRRMRRAKRICFKFLKNQEYDPSIKDVLEKQFCEDAMKVVFARLSTSVFTNLEYYYKKYPIHKDDLLIKLFQTILEKLSTCSKTDKVPETQSKIDNPTSCYIGGCASTSQPEEVSNIFDKTKLSSKAIFIYKSWRKRGVKEICKQYIFKETLKKTYIPARHSKIFTEMKQIVNARLEAILNNDMIESYLFMINKYIETYPQHKDRELLNLVITRLNEQESSLKMEGSEVMNQTTGGHANVNDRHSLDLTSNNTVEDIHQQQTQKVSTDNCNKLQSTADNVLESQNNETDQNVERALENSVNNNKDENTCTPDLNIVKVEIKDEPVIKIEDDIIKTEVQVKHIKENDKPYYEHNSATSCNTKSMPAPLKTSKPQIDKNKNKYWMHKRRHRTRTVKNKSTCGYRIRQMKRNINAAANLSSKIETLRSEIAQNSDVTVKQEFKEVVTIKQEFQGAATVSNQERVIKTEKQNSLVKVKIKPKEEYSDYY